MRRLIVCLAGIILAGVVVSPAGANTNRRAEAVDGSYIVVYRERVDHPTGATRALERSEGFRARLTFGHALKGFAAPLTAGQVRSLRSNPKVDFVAPDREVHAAGTVALASGDVAPTGVRRIEAATGSSVREASSANVAVIDTGIDLAHPDLNAAHGVNCMGTGLAQDQNGHGTHVAGTIAARNDGAGVVGVAPGTTLFAAKVLGATGNGSTSSVICGIDWVTSTRQDADPSNDIDIANLSLGGVGPPVQPCATTTDPQHLAICRSVAAGVTYVVAAGNDGWDFDHAKYPDVPAAYPQVLTVSAMSDTDGLPGGASRSCSGPDDSYAGYSNFAATAEGRAHTIAGPGSCIRSTAMGGGYTTMSGTSMATPHVAGVAALCFGENGATGPCSGLTPAQVMTRLMSDAKDRPSTYGFAGDPFRPVTGRYYGYLASLDRTAPVVTSISPAAGATGTDPAATITVTFSETMSQGTAEAAFSLTNVGDGSSVPGAFSWSGTTMRFTPASPLSKATSYAATVATGASDLSGNQLVEGKSWGFSTIRSVVAVPGATSIQWGSWRAGGAARLATEDGSYYEVNSTNHSPYGAGWYGRFTGITNSLSNLRATYKGKLSRSCRQTVSLWRWTTSSWVEIDGRTVASTPILIDKAVPGNAADYVSGVSGDGEVRMKVRCQTTGSFVSSGDVMKISFDRP